MNTLIVYAHPYDQSLNHEVYQRILKRLEREKEAFDVIDLYKDGFNPAYDVSELKLFSQGLTLDPLVTEYQQKLLCADSIIFVFPIWWSDTPAILKGFIDKVMKQSFAYSSTSTGVKGHLTHIKKAEVYTTSTSPTWYLRIFAGNAIQSVFIKTILKQIGIRKGTWRNCGNVGKRSRSSISSYLDSL